jgi:hypothetical protein
MNAGIVRRGMIAGLALVSLSLAAAGVASASEADRQHWVGRWEALLAKQQELSTELASARVDYRRGRRGNRGRGKDRVELLARIDKLETELAAVEQNLETFPEEARRAGALPGWFRQGAPAAATERRR